MFRRPRAAPPARNPAEALADDEFVRRILARDREAFAALVERHHERLVRLALVYLGERGMAEEVVQDTWAAVLENLASFEGRSALKTWLFRICVNRAKTRAEREARSAPFSALEPEAPEDVVPTERFDSEGMWSAPPDPWNAETPERALERRQALVVLARELDALPPAQRAVVMLRDVEGHEAADVCNILEISESNQRVLLHRGRTRLRKALEQYVGSESSS